MNGRDAAAAFLPLDFNSHPTVGQYLTRDQARYKGRNRGND